MDVSLIAIDGPAGSGKSTLGGRLAKRLNFVMLDAGLLYRLVAREVAASAVDPDDPDAVAAHAQPVLAKVGFDGDGSGQRGLAYDGVPFDQLGLQTDAVTELVPRVAKHPGLRQQVRAFQEMVANQGKAILAGRDIGTVVAPHADLKLYLDVSLEERAARRQWADDTSETQEELAERLRIRDDQDRSRATSPLKIPDDAVVVCTDKLSVDDAVSLIVAMCGLQVDPA